MTKFKKQIVSATAAGVMLLNIATPALAGTSITISGNGAGSDNWTTVNQENKTVVNQNNKANVTNKVKADAKTGGNSANFNTGGNVAIGTGDAGVATKIENLLNTNSAEVGCCETGDTEVKISGNGADTENGVELFKDNVAKVKQDNDAKVNNDVNANAKTGGNDAYKNSGGDVIVGTGKAFVVADISTVANVNAAKVSSALGSSNPSASFIISKNGAGGDSYVTANLEKFTEVDQENDARVSNDVEADAETGDNNTGFNTGGDVIVGTGKALVLAEVDNAVNFNYADVDCGCTWDVTAEIAGNGADTDKWWEDDADNLIDLYLDSVQLLGQENEAGLENELEDLEAKTGNNNAELNTGEAESDPAIGTGDAYAYSGVENSGNVNTVGDFSFGMPEFPNMDDYEFSFSFDGIMAFFEGLSN